MKAFKTKNIYQSYPFKYNLKEICDQIKSGKKSDKSKFSKWEYWLFRSILEKQYYQKLCIVQSYFFCSKNLRKEGEDQKSRRHKQVK